MALSRTHWPWAWERLRSSELADGLSRNEMNSCVGPLTSFWKISSIGPIWCNFWLQILYNLFLDGWSAGQNSGRCSKSPNIFSQVGMTQYPPELDDQCLFKDSVRYRPLSILATTLLLLTSYALLPANLQIGWGDNREALVGSKYFNDDNSEHSLTNWGCQYSQIFSLTSFLNLLICRII